MKKGLAFILFIIVAVAVFVPCCTTDNCDADQTTSTDSQNHPIKQEGACSPFFSCSSCGGFVVMAKIAQVTAIPEAILEHHDRQCFFAPSSYTHSLLQPPKFFI
jgi:hypothetical protein